MVRDIPFQTLEEINEYFCHEKIECLICGQWFNSISGTHLKNHGFNARSYKEKFGLPLTRGLIGFNTADKLKQWVARSHAFENIKKAKSSTKGILLPPFRLIQNKKARACAMEALRIAREKKTHCSCGLPLEIRKSDNRKVCRPCLAATKRKQVLRDPERIAEQKRRAYLKRKQSLHGENFNSTSLAAE